GGAVRVPEGVPLLLRGQAEAPAAAHARRGRREPRDDAAPSYEALRSNSRQRRHRTFGDAAARAPLVLRDGVERAAHRRDDPLVRQIREGGAATGGCDAASAVMRCWRSRLSCVWTWALRCPVLR